MGSPMTCAYCTRRSLVTIMIDCERRDNFYFVAFVFIKEFTMFKNWFTLRYAPLRPYVNRCARRIALFVWYWPNKTPRILLRGSGVFSVCSWP